MNRKNKKILITLVSIILVVIIAAAGWFFIRPPFQWLALEDISVEVVWHEEDAVVHMFDGMFAIDFCTEEPVAYFGSVHIVLRDGVRIRNGNSYIRRRDLAVLSQYANTVAEADAAPVGVIVNGLYGEGTDEQNAMIHTLLGGDLARDRFEVYFQWYNTIHELGHLITVYHGTYNPNDMEGTRHMVDEELLVNSFAVAFWLHFGEDEKIYALEEVVNYALSNLSPPVENVSPLDFMRNAVDERREEVFSFEIYGWFQFSLVRDILLERESLDLEAILAEMTGEANIQLPPPSQTLVYSTLGVDIVPQIVADAIFVLRELGMSIPDTYISFSTDPNNHSLQYPMPRVLLESSIATGRLIPAQ